MPHSTSASELLSFTQMPNANGIYNWPRCPPLSLEVNISESHKLNLRSLPSDP